MRELFGHMSWAFTRPEVWLLAALWVAAEVWAAHRRRRAGRPVRWQALAARTAAAAWLAIVLALTILPKWGPLWFDVAGPDDFRARHAWAFVPGASTVRAYTEADGYLMDDATYERRRAELAADQGIPVADVKLDRRVYGPGYRIITKDLVGNLLLMGPLGFLAPLGGVRFRTAGRVAAGAATLSVAIEASQLVFGWGTYTVDDVLLNTAGALLGFAALRAGEHLWRRVRPLTRPAPAGAAP